MFSFIVTMRHME